MYLSHLRQQLLELLDLPRRILNLSQRAQAVLAEEADRRLVRQAQELLFVVHAGFVTKEGFIVYNSTLPRMRILTEPITRQALKAMAEALFGNLVKAVVDVERKLLAVDAELHSDLEALLLAEGSAQQHVWGINLYPDMPDDTLIEFDSMINMRPSQNNRSRGVDDPQLRKTITEIVASRIQG